MMIINKKSILLGATACLLSTLGLVLLGSDPALVEEGATKVYKQVDANGHITFTDSPPIDNTQTIEEIEVNVKSSGITLDKTSTQEAAAQAAIQEQAEANMSDSVKKENKNYQLSITTPKSGQVFSPETLEILSGIEIQPRLGEDDRIQVLINDSPVLPPQSETAFKLPFLPSGKHELKVKVIDKEGNIIGESAPVNFTQMRVSTQ